MKRIVIVGDGYQAGKAFRIAGRIHPKADLVWITDSGDEKYSLSMLALLLRSGAGPDEWSRIRARIKVDFERYQKSINLFPQKVKKISIDPKESTVSFRSGMGDMSYVFDKVLFFPAKTVRRDKDFQDCQYLWPEDTCIRYLVDNWKTLEAPVVVGSDLSLIQAMVCGRKKCTWIRTGNLFSGQIQFFLDQMLSSAGIDIIQADKGSGLKGVLEKETESQTQRPVIFCGNCGIDPAFPDRYGLGSDQVAFGNSEQVHAASAVVIDVCLPDNACPGYGPENELFLSRNMVESALGKQGSAPKHSRIMFWNMGDISAARIGLDVQTAQQLGFSPEVALVHGFHGIKWDKPYALSMVMDKPTQKIIGLEAVGQRAHDWVNLAASLLKNGNTVADLAGMDMVWPEPDINPLARCALILENKTRPGILGITPDELKQSADDGAEFFLMDVRTYEEFSRGRIPGASNIPLQQLKKSAAQIPRFTPLVMYSGCSGRAYEAARLLKQLGAKQLYVLDGGYGLYTLDRDESPCDQ